jgi:protein-disulfide isomerase
MIADYANSAPGVDGLKLGRCLDSKETEPEIARALEEAEALGLNSTPTLFVNGRRITTQLPWGNLKQIIDFEIDYQKTARNAGDADCCSVTLPAPVAQ